MGTLSELLKDRLNLEARREPVVEGPEPISAAELMRRHEAAIQRYAEEDALGDTLSREVFLPLVEEFRDVLQTGGILANEGGKVEQFRVPRGAHVCSYLGRDADGEDRAYYVSISALAWRHGGLELSAACCHDAARDCRRRRPKTPLVEFLPKLISPAAADRDAARAWCEGVLKAAAEAIIDAIYRPAAPVHAPLCAVPVPIDMPMTV